MRQTLDFKLHHQQEASVSCTVTVLSAVNDHLISGLTGSHASVDRLGSCISRIPAVPTTPSHPPNPFWLFTELSLSLSVLEMKPPSF
jgi:hypothetical protein